MSYVRQICDPARNTGYCPDFRISAYKEDPISFTPRLGLYYHESGARAGASRPGLQQAA